MSSDPSLTKTVAFPASQPATAGSPVQPNESEAAQWPVGDESRVLTAHFLLFNAMPAWLVSMVLHMIVLLVLAMVSVNSDGDGPVTVVSAANAAEFEEVQEFDLPEEMTPIDVPEMSVTPMATPAGAVLPQEVTQLGVATDLDAAPAAIDLAEFSETTAPKGELMKEAGLLSGTGLEGRGAAMRAQMIGRYGGSKGSEEAVVLALQWFAEHQLQDGSWSFEHRGGRCAGRCGNPGNIKDCFTGATAMALLPFLGAGQTHREGQYKDNVAAGLAFLVRSMQPSGSLMQGGGTMYSHGLASIALCEAYAMTNDRKLLAPAQAALNFIVFAQDPIGGGWRYQPQQPGDTSVVGWQLMALKSGHMAYLRVPPRTVMMANRFLDSVQAEGGAKYGYSFPAGRASTTAVGLLCRMYLGWKQDNPALQRGVEFLGSVGPDTSDMYYNYYATQVMRHWGGEPWEKWNAVMRDQLTNSQAKEGHARGSWDVVGGGHANDRGGRLYFTAMATMILEVYYRHLPIYGKQAAEEEFPL